MLNTKKDRISLKNIIPVMNKHCNSRVVLFVKMKCRFFSSLDARSCVIAILFEKKVLFYELMKWKKNWRKNSAIRTLTRKLNSTTEKRICARDYSSSTNKVDSVQQTRTGNILAVYFLKILGERGAFAPDRKFVWLFWMVLPTLILSAILQTGYN